MAEISLRRKKIPYIPDNSSNIVVVFEDIANPLTDEDGNTRNPIPEYPEIVISIPIPVDSIIDSALVGTLMAQALDAGTLQAQERANRLELKNALKPLLVAYDSETPAEMFVGEVTGATSYIKPVLKGDVLGK